ncbi:MAG: Bax inhibitor-1 family protein [Bacteroidota bacterium]
MDNQNQILDYLKPVAQESELDRADFIRKTYTHLALAVLAFIVVEALFLNTPIIVEIGLKMTQGMTWLLVLGGFMFVTSFATKWASSTTDRSKQYAGLLLYVLAQAFIFVPLIYIAIAVTGDLTLINQAALLTFGLFTGLSAVAFLTKKDFSFLGKIITIGGFIALGLIAAGILFGFNLGLWFSFAMVALAAGSILYQTSNIIHEYHKEQYVAASLGLFSSLMLLFWYILSIVLRFTSSD